jgi:hypothetical protein
MQSGLKTSSSAKPLSEAGEAACATLRLSRAGGRRERGVNTGLSAPRAGVEARGVTGALIFFKYYLRVKVILIEIKNPFSTKFKFLNF